MEKFIMNKIAIILLFLFSFSFAQNFDKYLKSERRASIGLQKLVDNEGDYKKAVEFSKLAIKKYPKSIMIRQYRAKALYLTKNLDEAKILFIKILEEDPTNDIAADFIKKIEKQEEAHKNKDLEDILEYIADKGLDFLLIFLGFLGAEVLAKRFNSCYSGNYISVVKRYVYYYNIENPGYLDKLVFITKNYFRPSNFISMCNFLSIIVLLIMSTSFTLGYYWLEIQGYVNIFISEESLKTISGSDLGYNYLVLWVIFSILMVAFKTFVLLLNDFETKEDVADTLQELFENGEYSTFRHRLSLLNDNISQKDLEDIRNLCFNSDVKDAMDEVCFKDKGS
jgi:tetratricopeptide (TPR) repeat protein